MSCMSDFGTSILVCQRFPFSQETGEVYLRTEIEALSSHSRRVIVLSCFSSGDEPSCPLPDNVIVRSIAVGPDGSTQKLEAVKAAARVLVPGCGHRVPGDAGDFGRHVYLEAMYGLANGVCSKAEGVLGELCTGACDIDLVYSYRLTLTAYVASFIADWADAHGVERPLAISRAHGHDLYEDCAHRPVQPFRHEVLEAMDRIFPCSEEGAAHLRSMHSDYADKIEASYLGSRGATAASAFRARDAIRMVSCSTLDPVKRVNLIADAVGQLTRSGIDVEWTHIGSGRGLSKLEKRCNGRLAAGTFRFVGALDNDEVFALYEMLDADLFVNVSSSEGIPQAIMEALSFGVPVVATGVGGNSEIVIDGLNGWLIDAVDAARGLAFAVEEYASLSSQRKEALRRCARTTWEERFSAKVNSERFMCRLRELSGGVR